jgi:hypothetical protein
MGHGKLNIIFRRALSRLRVASYVRELGDASSRQSVSVRETPSTSPLRRSPAFVCDRFLNSRKRILNEQEKIDLLFRQSTLSGILGHSAAMFH